MENKTDNKEKNKYVLDMTKGSPLKLLLSFAIPLLIGNLFQQLYNLVDSIVVGQWVGANALGAVGATGSITFLIVSLVIGLSVGIGIIVAQYFGAGDDEMVKNAIGNSVYIVAAAAILMSCVGFFAAKPVLNLLDTPMEILPDAVIYLKTTSLGIIAVASFNLVSAILRSLGDSKTPLKFLVVACVINIVLDLVFVIAFDMGVMGVGIATAVAQIMAAISCLIYAYKSNSYFRLHKGNFKFSTQILVKTIRVGLPVAIQNAMIAFSLVALQKVVNGFGSSFVTAFTVVSRIEQIVQQPFMSLGSALATYTGQNIGAGKIGRVKQGFKTATIASTIFAIVVMLLFQITAPYMVRIFGNDPKVIALAVRGIRVTSCFYIFLGLIYTTRNVLNGAGDAGFSVMTGIIEVIGRVGFAKPLTLIPFIGLNGVWLTTGITWLLNGTISCIRYKGGKWKTKALVKFH